MTYKYLVTDEYGSMEAKDEDEAIKWATEMSMDKPGTTIHVLKAEVVATVVTPTEPKPEVQYAPRDTVSLDPYYDHYNPEEPEAGSIAAEAKRLAEVEARKEAAKAKAKANDPFANLLANRREAVSEADFA